MQKIATVIGVGPGLGIAAAKRFAKGGYSVARNKDKIEGAKAEIEKAGGKAIAVSADATSEKSIHEAFETIRKELGHTEVLIYNAGAFKMKSIADTSAQEFEDSWKSNCFGAFLSVKEVLPNMLKEKKGTILFTGATAALRGGANFSCLSVGKFGLRSLSQSLAKEVGPQGIHVAHIIIDGQIDTPTVRSYFPDRAPETFLNPDDIAETYWHIHNQPKTTWTQELDLRPNVEKW